MTRTTVPFNNDDCKIVHRMWKMMSDPSQGKYYLGNIIKNGLKIPLIGIDIPPFSTIGIPDIPPLSMLRWGEFYVNIAMKGQTLSGLDTFQSGSLICQPVSPDETVIDLALNFASPRHSGSYRLSTGGIPCALAANAGYIGGAGTSLPFSGPETDPDLELATWFRDVPLEESENGKTLIGLYYVHQDTIQKVTQADNNFAKQYRALLKKQKTTAAAVSDSTRYYKEHRSGANPTGEPPKIGKAEQYAGGFNTYAKLQLATQYMIQAEGLNIRERNEYTELLNSMEHFNDEVLDFQDKNPGERDTATIMEYIAKAESNRDTQRQRQIPIYNLETGEVVDHMPTWPLDRERVALGLAAYYDGRARASGIDIDGGFTDSIQGFSFRITVSFTREKENLLATAKSVQLSAQDLFITLEHKEKFGLFPGLYDAVSNWLVKTPFFKDLVRSKINQAANTPAMLKHFSDAINAVLNKLSE